MCQFKMDWIYSHLMNHLSLLKPCMSQRCWWFDDCEGKKKKKQGYTDISGATSVSTSPHQRTSSGRCQRRRKSLIKVQVWGYYLGYVKLITPKKKCISHFSASLSACLSILKPFLDLWDVWKWASLKLQLERKDKKQKKHKRRRDNPTLADFSLEVTHTHTDTHAHTLQTKSGEICISLFFSG